MIIIGRSRDALLCHWLASGSYAINPIDFTAQKEPITRLFLRIRRLIPGDGVCLLRNGSLVPDKTFHKKIQRKGGRHGGGARGRARGAWGGHTLVTRRSGLCGSNARTERRRSKDTMPPASAAATEKP